MNLSFVEYYLADFISAMEFQNKIITLQGPSELKTNDTEFPIISNRIHVPKNFKIIGTINIDETTKKISPKVLDRAGIVNIFEVSFDLAFKKYNKMEVYDDLKDLFTRLEDAHFIVGYRTWENIFQTIDQGQNESQNLILDSQIETRILPKLEGLRVYVEKPLLAVLLWALNETETRIDSKSILDHIQNCKNSRFLGTFKKAKQMFVDMCNRGEALYYIW